MKIYSVRIIACAALLLASMTNVLVAETYQFERQFQKGTSRIEKSIVGESTTTFHVGEDKPNTTQQRLDQVFNLTMTIDEVSADGQIDKATFVVDPESGDTFETTGAKKQVIPNPMAGGTITMTNIGGGNYEVDVDRSMMNSGELMVLMTGEDSIAPLSAVSIGDSWKIERRALTLLTGSQGKEDAGTVTLVSVEELNGQRVANVELDIKIRDEQFGGEMEMELKGTGIIDLRTSRCHKLDLAGTMNGRAKEEHTTVKVDGKTTLSWRQTPVAPSST